PDGDNNAASHPTSKGTRANRKNPCCLEKDGMAKPRHVTVGSKRNTTPDAEKNLALRMFLSGPRQAWRIGSSQDACDLARHERTLRPVCCTIVDKVYSALFYAS